MLIHNNKITCYTNSFVILKYMLCKYAYHIVITHLSYAISYINVLNDLCLYAKRPYTFPHLYNATPYYRGICQFVLFYYFNRVINRFYI